MQNYSSLHSNHISAIVSCGFLQVSVVFGNLLGISEISNYNYYKLIYSDVPIYKVRDFLPTMVFASAKPKSSFTTSTVRHGMIRHPQGHFGVLFIYVFPADIWGCIATVTDWMKLSTAWGFRKGHLMEF